MGPILAPPRRLCDVFLRSFFNFGNSKDVHGTGTFGGLDQGLFPPPWRQGHALQPLAGKIYASGIVYMGDGSWGVSPRGTTRNAFYLLKQEKINCVSLITVDKQSLKVETFNEDSKLVDEWNPKAL